MEVHPRTSQAYRLFHDGILALGRAERQGIRVDIEYAQTKKKHLTRKIDRAEEKVKESKFYRRWQHVAKGTVNINSDPQLRYYLYDILKLEPLKTTITGLGSTDEESLIGLNIPELNSIIEIRKLKKIRDTYLDAFVREQVNGYIHPFFNLHLPTTFRSSSDHPNFQNIPNRDKEAMQLVRKALYPRPGHQLLSADFSGLEVRIAACYHNDATMMKYINDVTTDMHRDMAEQIFMIDYDKSDPTHKYLRAAAKNGFVFPEFYGDWYKKCAAILAGKWGGLQDGRWKPGQGVAVADSHLADHLISKGIKSMDKFTNHVKEIEHDFWSNRFHGYAIWKDAWWATYQRHGYFDMKTGFRCSGVMGRNDATNWPIQGSAFHCLLWSLNKIDEIMRREKWDTKIIGQIHDEIVLDVNPKELSHVAETVNIVTCIDLPEEWKWITTPLEVEADLCEVDASWAEKKPFSLI